MKKYTLQHDNLQLWLYKQENQAKIIEAVTSLEPTTNDFNRDFRDLRPDRIEITRIAEHLIDTSIVDCALKIRTNFDSESGKRPKEVYDILISIEPSLRSVSSIIAQTKTLRQKHRRYFANIYENWKVVEGQDLSKPKPFSVILTYDKNTEFDEIIEDEDISIYRVE